MADSQGGTCSNTTGVSMSGSPTADHNPNAPNVGDSLESLGLSGDETCVTTPMAISQGGNHTNNTAESTCGLPTADSNYDAPRGGYSLEVLV